MRWCSWVFVLRLSRRPLAAAIKGTACEEEGIDRKMIFADELASPLIVCVGMTK